MQHSVTFKHVSIKPFFQNLVEELIARLDEQTANFGGEAVFTHVVIEQNKAKTLFKIALHTEVPRKTLTVHEEGHNAIATVREAFDELERQLSKYKAKTRREHLRKRTTRNKERAAAESSRESASGE